MNRGNFGLTVLSGKGTNWTEACSWWRSKQQAVELLLLRREWGAVLELLVGYQQEGIYWLEQQHNRVGKKEVGISFEMLLIEQYPSVELLQEYLASCFWCVLCLNWLLLHGARPEGTSDCMDCWSPLPSKATYLQGAVLASCQPKWQDVPDFLFRHSMCLH